MHRKGSNCIGRGFFSLEKGFYASEGVQLHWKMVFTMFQVNLVIPKAIFMVIFQPKEGICI